MRIEELSGFLDHPAEAVDWLRGCALTNLERAHANLVHMAAAGVTLDLLADICDQLAQLLPGCPDADMALNNLDRFVAAARNPLALASLFERDRDALPYLVQIFSTSQYLSDLLVTDSESYDLLRLTEGQPVARDVLAHELSSEVLNAASQRSVLAALRRFRHRETLRIAFGDIVRGQSLDTVTKQISAVAEAVLEAAVRSARVTLEEKRGVPRTPSGRPARFVILGMGKLGGNELNYSSDIDLILLYDQDGQTDGERPSTNDEYFDRLAREIVKLLVEPTEQGVAYRVDLRLRPEGRQGPMVTNLERALHYYDVLGRTWERQAYVKARPVAGDLELGREFLAELEPWIYRRYLSLADITGIKALKRRIEHRTSRDGADSRDVKTGHGGIRDIEFVIQFLQLLNGGDLPEVRTGNTLDALARLEGVGCLTSQERAILEENYGFLRKIEHRLQMMLDLQTHLLPEDRAELRKLAIRMSYSDTPQRPALEAFENDYRQKTELNRKILDHLLNDAFPDESRMEPEVDLVLDPEPTSDRIEEVLSRHGFRDVEMAYANLMALSNERIRFLSTRRCRHFLASIAPRLLSAIAATPDPDATLVNLEQVSDSLGGKGVLWELFSFNPPTLRLYVDLCAYSPLLSSILTSNPGMIDELMDSLVLDRLPTLEILRETLSDLVYGAEDLDPILHSFKHAQTLRVGVRDLLGKEDIQATTGALSDIARTCLEEIAHAEFERLVQKLGEPMIDAETHEARPCELVIVGMGKFGGRELSYHSDLDLIFLFEADGNTVAGARSRRAQVTTNQHFFSELGQRIIKAASQLGPFGRLYEVDPRLRPTGRSGALVTSFDELERYFADGNGQLWERQALTKAAIVLGATDAATRAAEVIARAAYGHPWQATDAQAIRQMRKRLEDSAARGNLKRGRGGLVDIEFLVQMLQLKHGGRRSEVRQPNTLDALTALQAAGHLGDDDARFFQESYRFLRTIESRLRLMNTTARDDLPDEPAELVKLARMTGHADPAALLAEIERYTTVNRQRFDKRFDAAEK
jgi:[glutamine synthetase] adenylyltransferase / [glutamine synthetase]-adenylyl-L-tyrosine phosphorylase